MFLLCCACSVLSYQFISTDSVTDSCSLLWWFFFFCCCYFFFFFPLLAPWRPVCRMIFQYASQIASSSHTQPLIQSQVENLLSKTYQKWKNGPLGNSGDGPSVDEIPWDDILATCIDHKLRDWKPPKLPVAPGIICPIARMTLPA